MKKTAYAFCAFLAAALLCLPCLANSPAPSDSLTIELTNLSSNMVYADLLIKIDQTCPEFTPLNHAKLEQTGFAETAQIVTYNQDGFMSFSFHYKNAQSNIKIFNISDIDPNYVEPEYEDGQISELAYSYVDFCRGLEYNEYLSQYENLLANYNCIKIAILDEKGDIVSVSEEIDISPPGQAYQFYGYIRYDVANEKIDPGITFNTFYALFSAIGTITLMLLSVALEVLVAVIFRLKSKQILAVLLVNIVTQTIMRALYFVLPFTYLVSTIILEMFVYGGEFFAYKMLWKEEKTAKIAIFTVAANTVSLLIGLYMIKFFGM